MAVGMMRLDKYLAEMGVGTRSEVKKAIRQGKVKVDGLVEKNPETKFDPKGKSVTYLDKPVAYVEFEYYMLNKPAGVISAVTDANERTVVDLIDSKTRKDLFPVGRLDKDTEGLLLITNDGDMAHRLLAPKKHVDKVYYAKVKGLVTEQDVEAFAKGVSLGQGEMAKPARLEILASDEISEIRLTIQEGKFHQVKRMFISVGKEVCYLKRLSMGSLVLDESLPLEAYRPLTEEELEKLC
ncbi:MAG: pseudouridine synthase [Faecalimonas sp.]|nr:pseudouridine synthase [Faecalimonas sp.]